MTKIIEYACNDESVMSATDHAFSEDKKELAYEYVTTANQRVIDDPRCADLELVYPRNLRGLHSQWAGAMYTWKEGIYGTFADLTDDEKQGLSDADSAGLKAMNELAKRYEEVTND